MKIKPLFLSLSVLPLLTMCNIKSVEAVFKPKCADCGPGGLPTPEPPCEDCGVGPGWVPEACPEELESLESLLPQSRGDTMWRDCLWKLGVDATDVDDKETQKAISKIFDANPEYTKKVRNLINNTSINKVSPTFNHKVIKSRKTPFREYFLFGTNQLLHSIYKNLLNSYANLDLEKGIPYTEEAATSASIYSYPTIWDFQRKSQSISLDNLLIPTRKETRPAFPSELKNQWTDSLAEVLDKKWPQTWSPTCVDAKNLNCSESHIFNGISPEIKIEVHQFWSNSVWRMGFAYVWDAQSMRLIADVDPFGNIRALYNLNVKKSKSEYTAEIAHYDNNFELVNKDKFSSYSDLTWLKLAINSDLKQNLREIASLVFAKTTTLMHSQICRHVRRSLLVQAP